jgi:hypothetical protein
MDEAALHCLADVSHLNGMPGRLIAKTREENRMKTAIALRSSPFAGLPGGVKAMVPSDRDDFNYAAGLPHRDAVLNTDRGWKRDAGSAAVSR